MLRRYDGKKEARATPLLHRRAVRRSASSVVPSPRWRTVSSRRRRGVTEGGGSAAIRDACAGAERGGRCGGREPGGGGGRGEAMRGGRSDLTRRGRRGRIPARRPHPAVCPAAAWQPLPRLLAPIPSCPPPPTERSIWGGRRSALPLLLLSLRLHRAGRTVLEGVSGRVELQ